MSVTALRRHAPSFTALLAAAAVTVGAVGCIEKRPRRRDPAAAEATAPAVAVFDPAAVDGALDHLVEGDRVAVPVDAAEPFEGAAEPLVTIVEFSDFECPFCGKLAANMAQMVLRYPEDVRLVFRQFPLQMHARAEPAARAAVAAGAQGKFWEMHDRLFADRTKLADMHLEAHAKEIGLDMTRFAEDLASPTTRAKVQAELAQGTALGVSSTPTFFVNGRKITGAKDVEALAQIVEEERAAASKLLAAGAKRNEIYARFMHALAPAKAAPTKPADAPAKAPDPEHKRGEASRSTNYAIGAGPGRAHLGPDDALVTVVAYADYGCTDCAAAWATFASVIEAHPEVRFSLRFLPTAPGAALAARAVLAAGAQGKLWETHRAIVASAGALDPVALGKLVGTLGIDVPRFQGELEAPPVTAMLEEDAGVVEVVRGTAPAPLFFVNGRILEGKATVAEFDALIAEEHRKADAFVKTEQISRAEAFEVMRRTWRGYNLIEAVPKAAAAGAPAGGAAVPAKAAPSADAKVTIIACTDFDCPACARGAKVLGELRQTYGDDIAVQYRHLVPPGRTTGELAHLAALAAGAQGKFWEMHDALYRSRSARTDAALEKLAVTIGLDIDAWNAARKDDKTRARLEEDTAACGSLGMTGLPSWKIGDEVIRGAQPRSRFVAAIDAALGK